MAGIIGRAEALGALDAALDRIDERPAPVLDIVGDPGIGKSRLLAELRSRAEGRGLLCLAGAAGEYEQSLPYGVFVEALDDHVAALPGPRLDALGPDRLARCAAVLPALSGPAETRAGLEERYRLHRAMGALLGLLAADRGLVLILDDLHWADAASIELLDFLCRHPPPGRLLLAAAYRPRQASSRLAAIMSRDARRIELAPLTRLEVSELVGERSEELYRASGGNPFYLLALAGSDRAAPPQRPGEAGVPAAVETALRAELDRAEPPARLVAQAAAVAGDPFDYAVAAEAADLATEEVLRRLDELIALDLIRPAEGPRRFQFRHPLVRQTVYRSAPEGFRLAAHTRAARALSRQGAAVSALAHHVELSATPGDARSIDVLARAAAEALPKAPETAAHWLDTALRLLPEEPAAESRRLELSLARARALVVSADVAAAGDLLDRILADLPAESSPERMAALALYALVVPMLAPDRARRLLLRELEQLPDDTSRDAARLKVALALVETNAGAFGGRDLASEAFTTAHACGDRLVQGEAAGLLAVRSAARGETEAAIRWYAAACRLVDGLYDAEVATGLAVLPSLAWAALLLDRYDDCLRYAERAVEIARSGGQGYVLTYLLNSRTVALRVLGRLADAEAAAETASDAIELSPDEGMRATVWCQRCWIAVWRGDPDAAVAHGLRAVAAGNIAGGQCRALAEAALVAARLAAGQPDAIELFLAAVGGPEAPDLDVLNRTTIYEYLTAGEIARGRIAAADDWAGRAEAGCPSGLPRRLGHALLARARVRLARRDGSGAAEHAFAAADAFSASTAWYEAAAAQLVAGRAHALTGDRDQAVAVLDVVRIRAGEFGARQLESQAVRELRRLGRRVSPAQAEAQGGALTRREQQVADLVARGLPSRVIADRLFLSPRTVDTHLTNIYAKLRVSSRAALAGVWVRRRQGAEPPGS